MEIIITLANVSMIVSVMGFIVGVVALSTHKEKK